MTIKSVLILDDEQSNLDVLSRQLRRHINAEFICTRFPSQAIQLARDNCFDIALLDVTIHYHGTQFGGLEVYKALVNKYGSSAIIAYSQYIDDELLQKYGLLINFVERHIDPQQWCRNLAGKMRSLRERQTCFVAMPFGTKFNRLFGTIKAAVEHNGYRCIRIDRRAFTKSIIDKIFEEIRSARLVIFVASGRNPNVFYEAGYSVALDKEVITIVDSHHNLPFDVRDRNAIRYDSGLGSLH